MKRITAFVLVFVALFSGYAMAATGRGETGVLSVGRHHREDALARQFDVWVMETDFAKYQIEIRNQLTKEEVGFDAALKIAQQLEADLLALSTFSGFAPTEKMRVVVVATDTKGKALEAPYGMNDLLVLPIEQVATGGYRACLASGFMRGIPAWLVQGMVGLVFDGTDDIRRLAEEVNIHADPGILGLSTVRFMPAFADERAIPTAKRLAAAFTDYLLTILEPKALFGLTAEETVAYKRDWLKSIGVTLPYTGEHEGTLNSGRYYTDEEKTLVVVFDAMTYRVKWHEEALHRPTIEELEEILFAGPTLREEVLNVLSANPSYAEKVDFARHITVFVDLEPPYNWSYKVIGMANVEKGTIEIYPRGASKATIGHEMVHTLMPCAAPWIDEGLVFYINDKILGNALLNEGTNFIYSQMRAVFDGLTEGFSPRQISIISAMNAYYLAHGGSLHSEAEYDIVLSWHASAYALAQVEGGKVLRFGEDANHFYQYTYDAYISFTCYLIERYSLEEVIEVALDYQAFPTVFGETFENLLNDWRQFLLGQ